MNWLQRHWDNFTAVTAALLPLSWLYRGVVSLRVTLFRLGLKRVEHLSVPVIVVGNITVGGTGKTPLVLWLVRFLKNHGFRPAVVSRGYGGRSSAWPIRVEPTSDPGTVGDEPLLLARKLFSPVMAGPRRVRAARAVLEQTDCDVIISDDGLQHYAMGRDIEIAVVDGIRRFGNGYCLPAGPLRESIARLDRVDACVVHGEAREGELGMSLKPLSFRRVDSPSVQEPTKAFNNQTVHAVAGVGNPSRFFDQLRTLGIDVAEHPFADHHRFRAQDIQFNDAASVIMTEKDAVKCEPFADERHWYLEVEAQPDPALGTLVLALLEQRRRPSTVNRDS